jgi:hypothetical protein
MVPRPLRRVLAVLAAFALAACTPQATEPMPVLPGLQAKLGTIAAVELRGPGNTTLVTLERAPDGWRVRERTGWRADRAALVRLLADLAGARREEPRTAQPEKYPRIGVEPVADAAPDSSGVEVDARGAGWDYALVVGTAPPTGRGRYVRVPTEPGAWLTRPDFAFPRTPAGWLDTHLLDEPLAHVEYVQSRDAAGHAFEIVHRDDRFRIADAPSAAMGDSYEGDKLAGALEGLRLEDVAADDGAAAERVVRFGLRDDRVLQLEAWRVEGRVWARVLECDAGGCAPRGRFEGRRFLLPAHAAAKLLLTREQILSPDAPQAPPPPPQISQDAVAEAVQRALQGAAAGAPAQEEPR